VQVMSEEEIKKYNKWQTDLDNLCDRIKFYICLCVCIFVLVFLIVLITTSIMYLNESTDFNDYNYFISDDESLSQ